MAIIRLKQQPRYRFSYCCTLGIRDINMGGHLGNDALVSLLHDARTRLLKFLDSRELDLGDAVTGIIMNELAVNYRAEGRLFDELTILSEITAIKAASFRICHLVKRAEEILAIAETGFAAFNYKERRISTLPETFLERLEQVEGTVET